MPARFNFFYYFLICFFKQKKENFFLYLTTLRGLRILYTYRFTRRLGRKWDHMGQEWNLMIKKFNDFLFITARNILIFQVKFFDLQLNILNFYIDYNNNPNKIDFYKNLTYVKEFNNTCSLYKTSVITYMQNLIIFFDF